MKQILEAQSRRIMDIIEYLSLDVDHASINELADLTMSSPKTTLSDLSLIHDNWGELLGMIKYRDIVSFLNQSTALMHIVYRDIFDHSLPVLFIKELFDNPHQNIEAYAFNLHTSESSLYRLLPRLNKIFNKYYIYINNQGSTYSIYSHKESYVRFFFALFFLETNYSDNAFNEQEIKVLSKIMDGIFKDYAPQSDEVHHTFLNVYYYIALTREQQGFNGEYFKDLYIEEAAVLLLSLNEQVERDIIARIHGDIIEMILPKKEDEKAITYLKNSLINNLNLSLDYKLDKKLYKVCSDIYVQSKFYPFNISSLFDRLGYFANSFKKEDLKTFNTIRRTTQDFSLMYSPHFFNQTEYLVYWLSIHFYEPMASREKTKICVLSDLGKEHNLLLSKIIQDNFSQTIVYSENIYPLAFSKSYIDFNPEDYDIILSTTYLSGLENNQYIIINDFLNSKDFTKIHDAIQRFNSYE